MSDSVVLLTKFGNRIIWLLYGSYKETNTDKSTIVDLHLNRPDPRSSLTRRQASGVTMISTDAQESLDIMKPASH